MDTEQRLRENRALWEQLVAEHVHSDFYDVRGFLEGADPLTELEDNSLGSVEGQSVLHLMCHFGLDSLALARRGAAVTGLDFSIEAVRVARMLAEREALDATFVCADVLNAQDAVDGREFDVVFTSWGVTVWLPDVTPWARVVASCLRPGGRFHLLEVHPLAWTFLDPEDTDRVSHEPLVAYETAGVTLSQRVDSSYAGEANVMGTQHLWHHGVGRIVSALAQAGLVLECLVERDVVTTQVLPVLVQREDGLWTWPDGHPSLPLSYEVVASKPG